MHANAAFKQLIGSTNFKHALKLDLLSCLKIINLSEGLCLIGMSSLERHSSGMLYHKRNIGKIKK